MDKSYINNIVQSVLNKEFSNNHKRRAVPYEDRVNFACPYCGDSQKNKRKARGYFYIKNNINK